MKDNNTSNINMVIHSSSVHSTPNDETRLSPDPTRDIQIKKLFSKVMTRQLEHATGSHIACIHHVFEVWDKLIKEHGIDCSEHFDVEDASVLNSMENPTAELLKVIVPYYKMFQEALEDDWVVNDFLMKVILKPHRTRAKNAVNRLAEYRIWR